MSPHRIEPYLDAIVFGLFGHLTGRGKYGPLRAPLSIVLECLDYQIPPLALAVVDLAQIQHLPLHTPVIGAVFGFDVLSVTLLLTVIEATVASQVHDAVILCTTLGA